MPPDDFSKAPYEIEPSSFSSPNNSCSYFFTSNKAPFRITKGLFFLLEILCIFRAINSFPDPVGPQMKTLDSVDETFSFVHLFYYIIT